jgi:hypothetical protein
MKTIIRIDFNRFVVACGLAREQENKEPLLGLLERIGAGAEPLITAEETKTLLNYLKPKRGRPVGSVTPKGDLMRYAVMLLIHGEAQLKAAGVWDFRMEAERQVIDRLIAEGYSEKTVRKLQLASARRRGKPRSIRPAKRV